MNKVWANCLIRGTMTWDSVPAIRVDGVREELKARVASGAITADKYQEITGEEYAE